MVTCRKCHKPVDMDGYCTGDLCPESCAVTATCRAAAEDWPDPYRSFEREDLDEADMTAVQCDGCGAWATVYYRADAWTADRDQETACYCARCEPERATGEYGHQPQGWVKPDRCTD